LYSFLIVIIFTKIEANYGMVIKIKRVVKKLNVKES